VNWGANPSSNLKPGYQATVIKELPFVGRTIYRDNYQGREGGKDTDMAKLISNSRYGVFRFIKMEDSFINSNFRSPVSPDFPFMGETTNNSTYRPFKTLKVGDAPLGKRVFLSKLFNFFWCFIIKVHGFITCLWRTIRVNS
jgi:hypothetical protein